MVLYTCSLCNKEFDRKSNYQKHINRQYNCVNRCPICDKVFPTPCRMRRHLNGKKSCVSYDTTAATSTTTGALIVDGGTGIAGNVHVGGTGTFAGVVNVDDNKPASVKNEKEFSSKLSNMENEIKCPKCNKVFSTNYGLKRHINAKTACDLQQFRDSENAIPIQKFENKKNIGHVYIMENEFIPNKFKVGHSKDLSRRLGEAEAFAPDIKVVTTIRSEHCHKAEILAHKLLKDYDIGREWFEADYNTVLKAVCDAVCFYT